MKKKFIFCQDTGIFQGHFVVACGYTEAELKKYVKKELIKKFYEEFCEVIKDMTAGTELHKATFYYSSTDRPCLLYLKEPKDSWEFWETLIHEITHIVDSLSARHGFADEREARAYLSEHLFHSIRRKLQGIDKI